jgi:diguanylate cyclase (GGDEF)-like protein
MSDVLKKNLRNTDVLARYGGEEFVIILPETNKDGAIIMAERIRKYVEEYPFPYQNIQITGNLTISIGVASLNRDGNVNELMGGHGKILIPQVMMN